MHYKTLEQVQAALAERIDKDKLQTRPDGFTYVPWEVTARQLDHVFGPFGWTESITHQQHDTERGIYIVSRVLTGYAATGSKDGAAYVAITREGIGTGQGDPSNNRATDTAIKAADSDSFSRAAKKLGDAFGLYLYDRDDPARQQQVQTVSAASTQPRPASNGRGPSEKQMTVFANNGYTAEMVAQLPDWRATLDGIFAQPKGQKRTLQPVAATDDIPF